MLEVLFDPIQRGPIWGSLFLGGLCALVGTFNFVQKKSLVSETLSHAAYPGVAIFLSILAFIVPGSLSDIYLWAILGGAFGSLSGLFIVNKLIKLKVSEDAALCGVLGLSLGVGVLVGSQMQFSSPQLYRHLQFYLFGQAATMGDYHIMLHGALFVAVAFSIKLILPFVQVFLFDYQYSKLQGLYTRYIHLYTVFLTVLAVIVGMRAGGVILIASLMIGPAVAARVITRTFKKMLVVSAILGCFCAAFGTMSSIYGEKFLALYGVKVVLPTGPSIAIATFLVAIMTLLLAPNHGWLPKTFRLMYFRWRCVQENILKTMLRFFPEKIEVIRICEFIPLPSFFVEIALMRLRSQGWVGYCQKRWFLTEDGKLRALHILRLHRLWELYLVEKVGLAKDRVHASAEEIEHLLTPELEKMLESQCQNIDLDPHKKPIPKANSL